jgi:hypothetical protein
VMSERGTKNQELRAQLDGIQSNVEDKERERREAFATSAAADAARDDVNARTAQLKVLLDIADARKKEEVQEHVDTFKIVHRFLAETPEDLPEFPFKVKKTMLDKLLRFPRLTNALTKLKPALMHRAGARPGQPADQTIIIEYLHREVANWLRDTHNPLFSGDSQQGENDPHFDKVQNYCSYVQDMLIHTLGLRKKVRLDISITQEERPEDRMKKKDNPEQAQLQAICIYKFNKKRGAEDMENVLQRRCRSLYGWAYGNGGDNNTIPCVGPGDPNKPHWIYFRFYFVSL